MLVAIRGAGGLPFYKPEASPQTLSISLFCVLSLLKRHIVYWSGYIHLRQIVCLENIFKKCIFGVPFIKVQMSLSDGAGTVNKI